MHITGKMPSPRVNRAHISCAVFNAVSKKGAFVESTLSSAAEPDNGTVDAALGDPGSWDAETKRAWQSFVKSSRLSEGDMWDPLAVDEGIEKIWVDLDKE